MALFKSTKGDVRLASTAGHVTIVTSEWTEVHESLIDEALAKRLIPRDLYDEALAEVAAAVKKEKEPEPEKKEPVEKQDGRKADVLNALSVVASMVEEGKTETEGGKKLVHNDRPLVAAVSEIAGFKVSGAEIDEALG